MKAILPFIFVLMLPMSAQEIGSTAQGARFIPGSIGPVATAIESHSHSENGIQQQEERAIGRAGLARTVRKAAHQSYRNGEITKAQRRILVMSTFSPAAMKDMEDLISLHINASGDQISGDFEVDADGRIVSSTIDWGGNVQGTVNGQTERSTWLEIIIKFLPILIEFLEHLLGDE